MAALVVLAANAGGAWSPIGDVTTHLPPYLGMLFSLSIIWITTERISLLALAGYFAGAAVMCLLFSL